MNKISFIKRIDSTLGRMICKTFSESSSSKVHAYTFKNILVIRPGGIGDAALVVPIIRSLRDNYPEASIDILAEKRNEAVYSLCPSINQVYCYDNIRDFIALFRKKYDVVIDSEQWHRLSAVVARLTRTPILIGFGTNDRKKLFTHPIPYSLDEPEVKSFFNLLLPLGIDMPSNPEGPFLSVPYELTDKIRPMLKPLSNRKIIAIFPGGSIKEKKWSTDKFRHLAKKLTEQKYGIIIIGGKHDIRESNAISEGLAGLLDLCGRLSLTESAAVLKEVSLLVTGDSGIMHLAYGLGKKILALFGPGNTKKWAPKGERTVIISKSLDCSPCSKFGYTPRCAYHAACIHQITVDEVYARALELLER